MIEIELTNPIYQDKVLKLSRRVNLIYGKNGSGKSTLCKLLKNCLTDFNVEVFSGFESVISSNNKLNLVTLGEKNVEIENNISKLNSTLQKVQEEKTAIDIELLEDENSKDNIFCKYKKIYEEYCSATNQLDKFLTSKASKIKNSPIRIAPPNYNKTKLSEEFSLGIPLSETEISQLNKTLLSEEKIASKIELLQLDFNKILNEVSLTLSIKATPKVELSEFKNNDQLASFAKEGLKLHKIGDKCAFCGSVISSKRYTEVKQYFDGDEVKELEDRIFNLKKKIQSLISLVSQITFDASLFYGKYSSCVYELESTLYKEKEIAKSFLNNLLEKLNNKKLFSSTNEHNEHIEPIDSKLNASIEQYNNLVEDNNSSSIDELKKKAMDKLRFNEIAKIKISCEYKKLVEKKKLCYEQFTKAQTEFELEKEKSDKLEAEISKIQDLIKQEKLKKTSVSKLATNINKKLKFYVNFTLEPVIENNSNISEETVGEYRIKSNTGETRAVTELSTGEKNIVAFLYFIEKLSSESDSTNNTENKIIVFDDPMNSNDDSIQYLIITELNNLINKCNKSKNTQETLVVLTHNTHFYLNLKIEIERFNNNNDSNEKDFLYHMNSVKGKTLFSKIENPNQDFKTSYEQLWNEFSFLVKQTSDDSCAFLLNPIRRIIETFTSFNCINTRTFYHNADADEFYKLNNVNSHSIDDLEAEIVGKNKNEILSMFENCFVANKASDHFNKFAKKFKLNWKKL